MTGEYKLSCYLRGWHQYEQEVVWVWSFLQPRFPISSWLSVLFLVEVVVAFASLFVFYVL